MLMGGAILFVCSFSSTSYCGFPSEVASFQSYRRSFQFTPNHQSSDIDRNARRFPTLVLVWLVVVGLCRLLNTQIDLSTRGRALLPLLIIIGGGCVLDAEFGEPIITDFMASHDYSQCEAGDCAQGNGKTRVWFADYVLQRVECRQRIRTVSERALFE